MKPGFSREFKLVKSLVSRIKSSPKKLCLHLKQQCGKCCSVLELVPNRTKGQITVPLHCNIETRYHTAETYSTSRTKNLQKKEAKTALIFWALEGDSKCEIIRKPFFFTSLHENILDSFHHYNNAEWSF